MKTWEKLALWFLFTFGWCGCAHQAVKAEAVVQEQTASESVSQAGSTAGIKARSGARHIGVSVIPAVDGGAPTFKLDVDDEADEVTAEASGQADGGSESAADAGAAGSGSAPDEPFWTPLKFGIAGVVGLLAVGGFAIFKFKKFPWVP